MDEVYRERGGGLMGKMFGFYFSASWPLSRIEISSDKVIVKVAWKTIELQFSDIVEVKRSFWLPYIADGVRIYHKRNDIPSLIIFWSLGNAKKICELLNRKLGKVPIAEN